jgi:hypothetical protein
MDHVVELIKGTNMNITSYDVLADGTKVMLNNGGRRGHVIGHRVSDVGVVVHTIQITERPKRLWGTNWEMEPHFEKWSGSYRFIVLI